jgi:hypothetical protein
MHSVTDRYGFRSSNVGLLAYCVELDPRLVLRCIKARMRQALKWRETTTYFSLFDSLEAA